MKNHKPYYTQNSFTLIELLISLLISSILMLGIMNAYINQQKIFLSQKQLVEMQQNIRAALSIMSKDIRLAGHDPYGAYNAGIIAAGNGYSGDFLAFTYVADNDGKDNNHNGNIDERGELRTIKYSFYDAYGDGDDDIGRKVDAGYNQSIIENVKNCKVQGVNLFSYFNKNGDLMSFPITNLLDIRAVKISITAIPDSKKADNASQTCTLTTTVRCRNLEL